MKEKRETCKTYNCEYFEKFGSCTCFIFCERCKEETFHFDKGCIFCGSKVKP